MKILSYKRKKKEKNLLKFNKIPGIIKIRNNINILIKINNNNYYYNIFKKNNYLDLIIINKTFKTYIKHINYHPYLKLIFHIELYEI